MFVISFENLTIVGRPSKVHGGFGCLVCPRSSFGKAFIAEDSNEQE
jgi:hypothetical protein